jgi:transcriptional regulator with XRE-family HTH domain
MGLDRIDIDVAENISVFLGKQKVVERKKPDVEKELKEEKTMTAQSVEANLDTNKSSKQNEFAPTFRLEISRMMEERKEDIEDFAHHVGVSSKSVRNWIDGLTSPSEESYEKIIKRYPHLNSYPVPIYPRGKNAGRLFTFRKKVKKARYKNKMSTHTVAKKIGMERDYYLACENGSRVLAPLFIERLKSIFPELENERENEIEKPFVMKESSKKLTRENFDPLLKDFMDRLREEMKSKHFSASKLMSDLSLAHQSFSNWNTLRNWPSDDVYLKLLKIFPNLHSAPWVNERERRSKGAYASHKTRILKQISFDKNRNTAQFSSTDIKGDFLMNSKHKDNNSFELISFGRRLDRIFASIDETQLGLFLEFLNKSDEVGMDIGQVVTLLKEESEARKSIRLSEGGLK